MLLKGLVKLGLLAGLGYVLHLPFRLVEHWGHGWINHRIAEDWQRWLNIPIEVFLGWVIPALVAVLLLWAAFSFARWSVITSAGGRPSWKSILFPLFVQIGRLGDSQNFIVDLETRLNILAGLERQAGWTSTYQGIVDLEQTLKNIDSQLRQLLGRDKRELYVRIQRERVDTPLPSLEEIASIEDDDQRSFLTGHEIFKWKVGLWRKNLEEVINLLEGSRAVGDSAPKLEP